MSQFIEKKIPLTKLNLDIDNSRHTESVNSQREIIEWMTGESKNIGEKVYSLAKDIAENGLNPLEKIMVVEDENDPGRFLVLEGNRRVTALKLLANPNACPSSWKSKYSKLVSKTKYQSQKNVACVVIEDLDSAFHFMEIKHLGELNGIGTVSWGAEEKAKHHKRQNKRSHYHKSLNLLDHVRESGLYDDETVNNASNSFPISTLDRLLGNVEFRNRMGLTVDKNGNLAFSVNPQEARKAIAKVVNDFGSKRKKVAAVINRESREEYWEEFSNEDRPDLTSNLEKKIPVGETIDIDAVNYKSSKKNTNKAHQYQDPNKRKKLVLIGTKMPIDASRFNRPRKIYEELKQLPLQGIATTYPNAIVLLLRTFLEMSVDSFIREKQMTHPNPSGWGELSLIEKIKSVKDYLKNNALMDAQKVKLLNKTLNDPNKTANPNSLNDYVHNPNQIPVPNDLVNVWDTYSDFLSCIWTELHKS